MAEEKDRCGLDGRVALPGWTVTYTGLGGSEVTTPVCDGCKKRLRGQTGLTVKFTEPPKSAEDPTKRTWGKYRRR